MSNANTKKYYHFHQQHFLILLYERQQHHKLFPPEYRYNLEKGRKSRSGAGSSSVCWLVFGLLIKLLCVNRSTAESLAVVAPLNNIGGATAVVTSTLDATATKVVPAKNLLINNLRADKRSQHSTFSELEKAVVESLIKEWAPVVWLAPDEKFMPLGVEEFLAHVHPESKDHAFTPGMPLGDDSEKSFLVTNTEIDKLLENGTSFIYGRNPNFSPVPIYAVVTLCDQGKNYDPSTPAIRSSYSSQTSEPLLQDNFLSTSSKARHPYIPITLGPQNKDDTQLRRSSRFYPMFHKVKRSLPNPSNIPQVSPYDLVMGEAVKNLPVNRTSSIDNRNSVDVEESEKVNNFIANLVDNVKFSTPINEKNNPIESKSSHRMSGFTYTEKTKIRSFYVTYWLFYPYSQGKNICTLSLGPFGHIPFPAVYGYCLGRKKDIGSHIGDWEHMTLYFTGSADPEAMYVSAHDAGAYYGYNRLTGSFEFKRQETRKGILQRPTFPKTVTTFNNHPVLFAAKGSHGLWTAPGKHRFVKVAKLYDINGFGTPWNTWKHVQITFENLKSHGRALTPSWLSFKGKWGNPKSKCHPLRRIGLNFCEFTDGPTGIPLKEPHFQCGTTFMR